MNFTDNPLERMMKQIPRPSREFAPKPPLGSPCQDCAYWQGAACVGLCYREFFIMRKGAGTSGQLDPKLAL